MSFGDSVNQFICVVLVGNNNEAELLGRTLINELLLIVVMRWSFNFSVPLGSQFFLLEAMRPLGRSSGDRHLGLYSTSDEHLDT